MNEGVPGLDFETSEPTRILRDMIFAGLFQIKPHNRA
jgi:hypothetical protein